MSYCELWINCNLVLLQDHQSALVQRSRFLLSSFHTTRARFLYLVFISQFVHLIEFLLYMDISTYFLYLSFLNWYTVFFDKTFCVVSKVLILKKKFFVCKKLFWYTIWYWFYNADCRYKKFSKIVIWSFPKIGTFPKSFMNTVKYCKFQKVQFSFPVLITSLLIFCWNYFLVWR